LLIERVSADAKVRKIRIVIAINRRDAVAKDVHEIDADSIDRVRGMDITVVTTAKTDEEARSLLRQLGFPFKEK